MLVAFLQVTTEQNSEWIVTPWPAHLKAYAEQYIDADWCVVHSEEDIWRKQPDVVAISVMSQDWDAVPRYIRVSRGVGARVVVGGHHVTGNKEEGGMARGQWPYTVIRGPGEAPFARMVANDPTIPDVASLDDIPMPDFKFGAKPGQKPTIVTSRGCPYRCTFCSQRNVFGGIQFHSPRRVVDEIKAIKAGFPNLRRLSIQDDLFAANKRRVRDIADLMQQESVKIQLNAGARSNLVSDESCRLWVSMGLTSVGIGGESGSQWILERLKGRWSSVDENQMALDTLSRNGISAGTGIIFGTPGETQDDIEATYEWLLGNYKAGTIDRHTVNILTPYPGTEVWDDAKDRGLVGGSDFKWSSLRHQSMNYRDERTHPGRRGWMRLRKLDSCVYLNEDTVPQEDLFEMIEHYERKIQWCSPAQILRTGKRRLERMIR